MDSMDKNKSKIQRDYAHVSGAIEDGASSLYEDGQKIITELYEEGVKKADIARAELDQYSDELLEKVRANPLKAVLISVGIGFVLSALLKK